MPKSPTVALFVAAVLLPLPLPAQDAVPDTLLRLVETERRFARRATVIGWRDAFLEFFADEAIALVPAPAPAKARLRRQRSQPFSVSELVWEPRTGEIAASGEIGWLTGPSTSMDHSTPGAKPRYGNYLSIWRRQPDGQWRVFIDVGTPVPEPAAVAPGFVRFPFGPSYAGKEGRAAAAAALLTADREMNQRIADGAAGSFAESLAPGARLHRAGFAPIVGRDAALAWLTAHAAPMSAATGAGHASESGDLGYTYGICREARSTADRAYLRVWQRTAAGHWLVVVDLVR